MPINQHFEQHAPSSPLSAIDDLEMQLSQVIERDDVTISTSRGVRRKKRFSRRNFESKVFQTSQAIASFTQTQADEIQELDRSAVDHLVKTQGKSQQYMIPIREQEHVRSAFVVSLQHLLFGSSRTPDDEQVPVHVAFAAPHRPVLSVRPVHAYATVSSDLISELDPWAVSDQFTPATFDEAYRKVYGGTERMTHALKEALSFIGSLFHRVERVEHQAIEHVEDSLALIEVPRFSFARALAGFAILAVIVTLPANAVSLYRIVAEQQEVAGEAGREALGSLIQAAQSESLPQSAESLKEASSHFRAADSLLADTSALALSVASVLPARYRSARALLEVGDKSTAAARLLALGLDKVFTDQTRRLDERLDVLGAYARSASVLLSDAAKAVETVDITDVPEDQRERASELLGHIDASKQAVEEFAGLADILSAMVGKQHLRKYLVIFQNQTELRPSGGFMGSLAEVTFDKGEMKSIRVPPGGTYDLKGQLTARVASPEPLRLINAQWQLQDANWSPDFPTTAKKIRWFWSKSGQSSVDGVIAVNASFVERLLAISGPIEMPEYGKTIDASNFLLETQKAVELEYDKVANTPKKFVGDLGVRLIERVKSFNKEEWLAVAELVSRSLESKDIQIAMSDPEEEALAEAYGWNGRLKAAPGDSLAIVEANIAGQKTDGVIAEQVMHNVNIQVDGTIQDEVILKRTHNGKKGELFRGVRNVSYVRFYVPRGSVLLSASGFEAPPERLFKSKDEDADPDPDIAQIESTERTGPGGVRIGQEGGQTVFGGWAQLDPGDSQTLVVRYRLPLTIQEILSRVSEQPLSEQPGTTSLSESRGAYLLLLTSQSGKTNREITTTIRAPSQWAISWSRQLSPSGPERSMKYAGQWDHDQVIGALFTPPHEQRSSSREGAAN